MFDYHDIFFKNDSITVLKKLFDNITEKKNLIFKDKLIKLPCPFQNSDPTSEQSDPPEPRPNQYVPQLSFNSRISFKMISTSMVSRLI